MYSKLLREDPTNTSTLLTTAEFLSRNGKSYEASNCLLRILQLDPSHLRAKELLQRTGEFTDHSLHAYPENKGTPFDVQAFRKTLNRGLELAKARQFQAALEVFELATQIHPRSAEAPFIDYILADEFVVAPEQQCYFSEKIVYMPGCFLVNDRKNRLGPEGPSRVDCKLPMGAFVFCCFNGCYKITSHVFDIWMSLLRSVPSAVLWLKDTNQFSNANLQLEAQRRGIQSDRLIFAPRCNILQEHIARYRHADLFLDTFPYNAHTTASDSLLAGCPVLTCVGEAFSARVAGSLLRSVGLPELVTTTWDEYQSMALDLARNPLRLAQLRNRLAANREQTSLFKMDVFARNIEKAYVKMWAIHTAGELHRSFFV